MIYRFSLQSFLTKAFAAFLACIVFGYFIDNIMLALSMAFFIVLIWNYRQLIKLIDWLWHKNLLYPPESEGVWGHVYDGIYRRIKAYRKKQKKLNSQALQFRDGAEALPDAVIVLNKFYAINWANKKASRLLGIRWPADSGLRINNLVRSPKLSKYLKKANFSQACKILSPYSDDVELELRFMPYGKDQFLLMVRDVSQSSRLESMRRDFVANVSHELKTPLTVMRGYIELINDDENLPPHWQFSMSEINQQVDRMDRLVKQLLVLSKVEVAGIDDIENKVDMPMLIDGVVSDLSLILKKKKHKLKLNVNQDFGLYGLESEIKSACSNLLVNAINYTDDGGEITLSWFEQRGNWTLSVQDNGCGISVLDLPRLTERFYRVDKSRSRDTGGTGLGLSIVKHVANHHNARLHIDSELGKGSCFSIYFRSQDVYSIKDGKNKEA